MPIFMPEREFSVSHRSSKDVAITTTFPSREETSVAARWIDSNFLYFLSRLQRDKLRQLSMHDIEPPNEAAIQNATKAFVNLWQLSLAPSEIMTSLEGGVSLSLVAGNTQAHFEFSNDSNFSLLMFAETGPIVVVSGAVNSVDFTNALDQLKTYLALRI